MIKREWITAKNGFEVGGRALYIDPGFPFNSAIFSFKTMETEISVHPTAPSKDFIKVLAENHAAPKYGTQVFLDPDGWLYPIDSPLYAYWNPALPDAKLFPHVIVMPISHGSNGQAYAYNTEQAKTVLYTTSGVKAVEAQVKGIEVLDRPDWVEDAR